MLYIRIRKHLIIIFVSSHSHNIEIAEKRAGNLTCDCAICFTYIRLYKISEKHRYCDSI